MPASARIILGVGAGIAAYKVCELLRLLTESGHRVRVVPTADALHFVGEPTWAALSGEPVTTDVWTGVSEVPHVRLGQSADLVLVAPATADLLARAAAGMAGDLLTATLLTARCPVLYAPAMHTEMWEHPATQANVSLLRSRGAVVLDPAVGRLTGADSGAGRLPEPPEQFRDWASGMWRPWYAALWAEAAVVTGHPDAAARIGRARMVTRDNPVAAAIVARAEALRGDRGGLAPAAAALAAAGCRYQWARTLVATGGTERARGESALAAMGATVMAWPPG